MDEHSSSVHTWRGVDEVAGLKLPDEVSRLKINGVGVVIIASDEHPPSFDGGARVLHEPAWCRAEREVPHLRCIAQVQSVDVSVIRTDDGCVVDYGGGGAALSSRHERGGVLENLA